MKNYCVSLDVENKWGNSAENALEGYEGMDENIRAYAKELRKMSEDGQLKIMNAVKNLVCYLGNGTEADYKSFCNDIKNKVDYSAIDQSLDEISSSSNSKEMGMVAYEVLTYAISDKDKINLTKAILAIICE